MPSMEPPTQNEDHITASETAGQTEPTIEDKYEAVDMLPATKVKNEVVWVNDSLNIPDEINKGKESRYGVFLDAEARGNIKLDMTPNHFRTGTLKSTQTKFADNLDKGGNMIYRDIDLKGIGYNEPIDFKESEAGGSYKFRIESLRQPNDSEAGVTRGILDLKEAKRAARRLEAAHDMGLRTVRYIMIARLYQIILPSGEIITTQEAHEKDLIPHNENPAVGMRAYGTRERVADTKRHLELEDSDKVIQDAKNLIAKEFDINKDDFDDKSYLSWFGQELGRQLACLHGESQKHGQLSDHNITLDCRLLDFDSLESLNPDVRDEEIEAAKEIISNFSDELLRYKGKDESIINDIINNIVSKFEDRYRHQLQTKSV